MGWLIVSRARKQAGLLLLDDGAYEFSLFIITTAFIWCCWLFIYLWRMERFGERHWDRNGILGLNNG